MPSPFKYGTVFSRRTLLFRPHHPMDSMTMTDLSWILFAICLLLGVAWALVTVHLCQRLMRIWQATAEEEEETSSTTNDLNNNNNNEEEAGRGGFWRAAASFVLYRPPVASHRAYDDNDVDDDAALCSICIHREPNVHLVPCRHRLCVDCAFRVERCPFCRAHISHRLRFPCPVATTTVGV